MTNVLANIARMASATTGTGTLTLGAAVQSCLTFADAGITNGQVVSYAIEDYDSGGTCIAREVGQGTYSSAGPTLARSSVYASTNGGAEINCSGLQHVFITAAAEDFATLLTASAADALFLTPAEGNAAYQPLDADLTAVAALTTAAYGLSLLETTSEANFKATVNLEAADILAALLTVDGAASGLDADLLDGQSSAFYATAAGLSDHLADPADAHDASAISFAPAGGIAATDVQAAIAELDTEKQAADATLTALAAYNTNGILAQTAADTFAGRTLTGTANQVVISNGDGVSGNPTFSLPQSIATSSNPQFATIELGDASDTTISRSAAGVLAVEGGVIPKENRINTFTANQLIVKANANINVVASTGDATAYVAAIAGQAATFRLTHWDGSAVVDRWLVGKSAAAESGSDAGSNLDIYSYTDAGAFKLTILRMTRAGDINFFQGIRSNGVTGGNLGAGTANFTTLYEAGTSLAAKYGALATANVWLAAQTVRIDNATTNAVTVGATLSHTTSGTPANGIGVSLAFEAETSAANNEVGATIEAVAVDVTSTSEDFDLVFKTMAAGAAAAERMRIKSTNSIICGTAALATNATDGFLYVPTCAGTPTGAPTAQTGMAPIVVDTTNNKLYFYSNAAWRDAGP